MATIKVVSLGTGRDVEIPDGCTLDKALEIAGVSDDLEVRVRGQNVARAERSETTLQNGDTVVANAPAVKHG